MERFVGLLGGTIQNVNSDAETLETFNYRDRDYQQSLGQVIIHPSRPILPPPWYFFVSIPVLFFPLNLMTMLGVNLCDVLLYADGGSRGDHRCSVHPCHVHIFLPQVFMEMPIHHPWYQHFFFFFFWWNKPQIWKMTFFPFQMLLQLLWPWWSQVHEARDQEDQNMHLCRLFPPLRGFCHRLHRKRPGIVDRTRNEIIIQKNA